MELCIFGVVISLVDLCEWDIGGDSFPKGAINYPIESSDVCLISSIEKGLFGR